MQYQMFCELLDRKKWPEIKTQLTCKVKLATACVHTAFENDNNENNFFKGIDFLLQ